MALSSRRCPDCGRRVRTPFQQTITGREVCADCAGALRAGTTVGAVSGDFGAGMGVWAMIMRRIRRKPPS